MGIRTLAAWGLYSERTGEKGISNYLNAGDIVSADLIIHIRNHMPLETNKPNYLQLEDVQGYSYDLARALKPIYPTFAESGGKWRYYGTCFKWGTINRL